MKPIVVLHGFTGRGSTMGTIVEPLSALCRVAAPDLAGHGERLGGRVVGGYSVVAMAKAVLSTLDEPHHVVGYSMGGRVALTMATIDPGRVASLSLIGASAGIADPDERAARAAADDQLAELIEHDLKRFVQQWMANPLFATQARLGADFLNTSRRQRLSNDPIELAKSLREASTGRMPPLYDALADLAMPIGLIVGDGDLKFCSIADALAEEMVDPCVHVIEDSGHATHLEQPEQTVAAIVETVNKAT